MRGHVPGDKVYVPHLQPGYQLVWEQDEGWEVLAPAQSALILCRRMGAGHVVCEKHAVARLDRRHSWETRPRWWAYCEDHLYGRRLEDGKVLVWRLGVLP